MDIKLKNFQSHKDSKIVIADVGITAITGKTNAGKSSIIRAIEHVKDNNLRGTNYVRKGESDCSVSINNVTLNKVKTKSYYSIDGNPDKLEALKCRVPNEVSTILNLSPDCIQNQHDSIFLLNQPGGAVAQKLSELIDLTQPHKAIKITNDEKNDAKSKKNITDLSIAKRTIRIDELQEVDIFNADLSNFEKTGSNLNETTQRVESLRALIHNANLSLLNLSKLPDVTKVQDCGELRSRATSLLARMHKLNQAEKIIDTAVSNEKFTKVQVPRVLYSKSLKLKASINKLKRLKLSIDKIDSLSMKHVEHPDELKNRLTKLKKDIEKAKTIKKTLEVISLMKSKIEANTKNMEIYKQEKKNLIGDVCPTCGTVLEVN